MRILVVDDIFTNRYLLTELLKTLGHNYTQVENGKEAIEVLEKEDFDLVLMDIEMPVMNGIEAVFHIRNSFPAPKNRIPIVALTAHNPQLFFEDFKDSKFDSLLTKPYNLEKLSGIIKDLIPGD
jgi:CheY-like chemotaxis protein